MKRLTGTDGKKKGITLKLIPLMLGLILIMGINFSVGALTTVESSILGGNSDSNGDGETDPLEYVFAIKEDDKDNKNNKDRSISSKLQLYHFVDLLKEGENLEKFCSKDIDYNYGSSESERIVIRSMVSTLQYIGLDLSTRAIAEYARYFEFSESEYDQLTKRLILNYCTKNLTVISLKQLEQNLFSKYKYSGKSPILVSYLDNPFFPPSLDQKIDLRKGKELEFMRTIKLFRAFCSWNGDVDDFRLLVPLLKNSVIVSWIIKQMVGVFRIWDQNYQAMFVRNPKSVRVLCEGVICRRVMDEGTYFSKFPRALGGKNVQQELSVRYCKNLKESKFEIKNQEEHIKKWIIEQSREDEFFLQSQFFYLITGIPDLLGRVEKYSDALELLRLSIDRDWDIWSEDASKLFSKEMFFEESVILSRSEPLVNDRCMRKWYLEEESAILKTEQSWAKEDVCWSIAFDLNLGEFDRTFKSFAKMNIHYDLKISESFLAWFWHEFTLYSRPQHKEKRDKLVEVLKKNIEDNLQTLRKKFAYPPWEGDLAAQVVQGIIELYAKSAVIKFNRRGGRKYIIRLHFNYGLFAMKYLHYRFRADHGDSTIDLTQ